MAAARPSSSSVESPIAETTTTRSWPAARSRAIRRATRLMRSASATEEPPNFWTTRGAGRSGIGAGILPCANREPRPTLRWRRPHRPAEDRPCASTSTAGRPSSRSPAARSTRPRLTLTADDGATFAAFRARATDPTGAGIIVLPDVRGLHPYFEELALRFAEHGVDAVAIDYFGRTAGDEPRGDDFEYMPHVSQTTWAGLGADIRAAAADLRSPAGGSVRSLFTIGFCMGGRLSFLAATLGLDLAGVVGFYGWPVGPSRNDTPAPVEMTARDGRRRSWRSSAERTRASRPRSIAEFEAALASAGVEHEVVTYPDAPHSFFDRKSGEFADTSEAAWEATLSFIRARTGRRRADEPPQALSLTLAGALRGATTSTRPVRSVSAAAAAKAPSMREMTVSESANARIVDPAPDRHAPIAPARGRPRQLGELRVDLRPVRLVQPVHRQPAEEIEPALGEAGDADRDGREVRDRVRARHGLGQDVAHLAGREPQVRDEQDGPQVARRIEADRLDAVRGHGRHDEPAQQGGGGVVGVALDLRGQAQQIQRSRAGRRAARCPRAGRPPWPRPRTPGRARAARCCASRCASRRRPGVAPRAARMAASMPRTNRLSRSSVSSPWPSPSMVSSISPRLQPRTSTSTLFVRASATPRQSYPAPRLAAEPGTSTATRRPSSSANQCATILPPTSPVRRRRRRPTHPLR